MDAQVFKMNLAEQDRIWRGIVASELKIENHEKDILYLENVQKAAEKADDPDHILELELKIKNTLKAIAVEKRKIREGQVWLDMMEKK